MTLPPPSTPEFNPYKPPSAEVADITTGDDIPLAGRGQRLGAQVINGLLTLPALIPYIIGLVMMFSGAEGLDSNTPPEFGTTTLVLFGIAVLMYLALGVVHLVFLVRYGQSIGKRLLGIRIARLDGSKPSIWRWFFLRVLPVGFLGAIPFIGFFFALANLLLIFRQDSKCLHDHIAGTKVVRG